MTKRRLLIGTGPLLAAIAVILWVASSQAQNTTADAAALVEALQLKPGQTVAEIGAGSGELSLAMGEQVGATGRVYTNELGASRLTALRRAVSKSGAGNIEVIDGHEAHANLPDACCDAVFMRNVYHHFNDPATMNASILSALEPGGRVAVIDFPPRNNASTAPPGRRGDSSAHGVNAETVATELKAAGFDIVSTDDRPNRWFMVVAAKTAGR